MKIFDENWNFLGEFIEDSKDKKSDSFDDSVDNGCVTFLYMIVLIIIVAIIWYILKGIFILCKFLLRIIWWLLDFRKEWPEF